MAQGLAHCSFESEGASLQHDWIVRRRASASCVLINLEYPQRLAKMSFCERHLALQENGRTVAEILA